ncbi:diguanylate cyclase [Paenibacillus tritici]|uniref:Diguanylate cyclase n=1 Tax=Paenibacillus tritici TaxID=1873425 RepID=A0ABX2DUI3_9BACL|nr:diguanylate cyclase [Paenibacillus tritici]NQX48353.1 diguanylate cyclase [Paenibacillus tritici]
MSPTQVWIPVVCYWLPMLFFFYMGMDVLLRNPKKIEHRLVSVSILCYFLMFLEEYIRYMLPIEYSPVLAAAWFANVGILIPGLGFHLMARLIGLHKRMPKPWYPYLLHILVLAIPAGLISQRSYTSVEMFTTSGVWKWPVANAAYYGTLTASLLLSFVPIAMLRSARKWSAADPAYQEHKGIFKLLEYGSWVTILWVAVFGYFRFGEVLPPYTYIYGGLIWCFVLRLSMQRYEFLNHAGQRYQKMFQINSQAALLVSLSGSIKEANPSANKMFDRLALGPANLADLGGADIVAKLKAQEDIGEIEAVLRSGDGMIEVMINGDYVTVDHEIYAVLLIRDIRLRNQHLRQIAFMAYHDPLTELPNRRQFYDKLGEALAEADRTGGELAILLIDLDRFKQVNDRWGHEAGDLVLCRVAVMVRELVQPYGLAARFGGDEFVLFCPVGREGLTAAELEHRLHIAATQATLDYEGEELRIDMSIGISLYPRDGTAPDALLRHADKRMYAVKRGDVEGGHEI